MIALMIVAIIVIIFIAIFIIFGDEIKTVKGRDPAAKSLLEVLLLYPGLHALVLYRIRRGDPGRCLKIPAIYFQIAFIRHQRIPGETPLNGKVIQEFRDQGFHFPFTTNALITTPGLKFLLISRSTECISEVIRS